MRVHLPLREAGVDRQRVIDILESSGVGEPAYYRWRSRSGCTFCFFQQKIEWVRLMREHPEAFEDAKSYEKSAQEHGSPFTWSQGESLDDLSRPERVAQIEAEWEARQRRLAARRRSNPLAAGLPPTIDEAYGISEADAGCLVCHK